MTRDEFLDYMVITAAVHMLDKPREEAQAEYEADKNAFMYKEGRETFGRIFDDIEPLIREEFAKRAEEIKADITGAYVADVFRNRFVVFGAAQ